MTHLLDPACWLCRYQSRAEATTDVFGKVDLVHVRKTLPRCNNLKSPFYARRCHSVKTCEMFEHFDVPSASGHARKP